MNSFLEYVRDNGHERRFGALIVLWHQAIPDVCLDAHSMSLAFRFNSYMQSFNKQIHLQSGYDICALFVETEQAQIYGMLSAGGNCAM